MTHSLPRNWVLCQLEDVADWGSGGTPSRANTAYFNGDIPWIKTGELGDMYLRRAEEHISREAIQNSSAKVFPKGSVAIAMYGATIGKASILAIDAATNQACAVAQPISGILTSEYLYYYVISQLRGFVDAGKGGAQPNISQAIIKNWPIPLPTINEQRRIVAKIDELFSELDKGVESLTTAREQLTAYRHSVLKAAFEGRLTDKWRRHQKTLASATAIVAEALAERTRGKQTPPRDDTVVQPAVPDAWGTVALGDLSVDVFDGPFGSNLKTSDYVDAGVRVIRLENIGHGKFIEEKRSYVSMEKYEGLKRHTIVPGDIVVSSFVTDAIRSTIVPASVPVSINKADCFAVRFQGQAMLPEFAQRFLESRCAYKQVEGMIHGVGRPRINTTQLKQVVLPICSRAEQIEVLSAISAAYSEIDALDAELSAQMQKAAALRQSILKRAFSGQLVAQDAADEPASVLLARIRAEREEAGATKRRNNKNGKKEAA